MCYILYAGADHELPVLEPPDWPPSALPDDDWPVRAPRLLVFSLDPGRLAVRVHLRDISVVRIGSYEGCGCGFRLLSDEVPVPDESVEAMVCRESRRALAEYVAANQIQSLYGCWEGDEELPSEGEVTITIAQLADASIHLPERIRLRVHSENS